MLKKNPFISPPLGNQKGNKVPQNVRGALLANITLEHLYVIQRARVEQGKQKNRGLFYTTNTALSKPLNVG